MAFGFGPQEMLERAQVPDKWQLTPLKNFKSPRIRARMWRTALAVLLTAIVYEYLLSERNPCFALIGAVYAVGSQFEEGFHNGINRVIGTLVQFCAGGGLGNSAWKRDLFCCDLHSRNRAGPPLHNCPHSGHRRRCIDCSFNVRIVAVKARQRKWSFHKNLLG